MKITKFKTNIIILASIAVFQLSSCALLLVSEKQKINIAVNNDSTSIYINNEEQGIGKTYTKVVKDGALGVVLKTEGYPLQHEVILGTRYAAWAFPLCVLDIPLGGLSEMTMTKMYSYNSSTEFKLLPRLVTRNTSDKYIDFRGISADVVDKNVDLTDLVIKFYPKNQEEAMDKSDSIYHYELNKKKNTTSKKEKKVVKSLENTDLTVKGTYIKRSNNIYKTLNKTGFIDTVSKVFLDHSNTIMVEGVLTKNYFYSFYNSNVRDQNSFNKNYYKSRVGITWYIKNSYGEKIDSVTNWTSSGSFAKTSAEDIIDDAVNRSLQVFLSSDKAQRNLKIDTNYIISDAPLVINTPKKMVISAEDATLASVIIKRKDKGHGSGFAISNDGYILTNYHVIAGEYENKPAEFTVVLSNGEEVKANVIRYNKMRDVALLKVDVPLEKAFKLNNEKTFKRLMEVYAVGTPKSIELGQSVSIGILSNERKTNKNNLLQLNMSVNSGNSGGPLFDSNGNLHGIVTSKLVGFSTEGVSFAIPTYAVADYLNLK